MNVSLVVVRGKPHGVEIPIRVPKFLIGRGKECHLRPNSELVSRLHAVFIVEEAEVRLRDMGSTNGTLVNGQRVQGEVVLDDGDVIEVGPLAFRLLIRQPAARAQQAPVLQPAAEPTKERQGAVAEPQAPPDKLGPENMAEVDIEQILLADSAHEVPSNQEAVYSQDTQMIANLDTLAEKPNQAVEKEEQRKDEQQPEEYRTVSGRKVKVGSMKAKIEKTREDTSRAAAEILRRMMERRR